MGPVKDLQLRKNQKVINEPVYDPLTLEDIRAICSEIRAAGSSSAIGSYFLEPEPTDRNSNKFLQLLRSDEFSNKSLEELQEIGVDIDISIDDDFILDIFNKTKSQAASSDWHNVR
jgi:hypothetical protein